MRAKIKSVLRLAWPYILMIVLPIFSVFVLSGYIFSNHTEQLISDQDSALEVAVDRVDQQITSITELSYLIAENDTVFQYVVNGMAGIENDVQASQQIQDLLSGVSKNDNVAEIYFYDTNTGGIIASETTLHDAQLFFKYRYQFVDSTPEELVDRLQNARWGYGYTSAAKAVVNSKPMEVVEYRLSVPVDRFGDHQSQLVICMDVQELFQDFFDELHDGAEFYIYSPDGLIYSSGSSYLDLADQELPDHLQRMDKLKGDPYAVEHTFNSGTWRVQFVYPQLQGAASSQKLMSRLLPSIVIPVLLSIALCVYFTHRNHREITEIFSVLRGEDTTDEEWKEPQYISHELIRSYAGHMAERNSAYQTKLREIKVSQKSSVLERLLRNAYRSDAEKKKALAAVDLQIGHGKCVVLCIQFDDICNEFFTIHDITVRDMIIDLLQTHAGVTLEVLDSLPTEIISVMAVDEGFEAIRDEIISMLNVQISYEYGVDLRIGVGNAVDSVYDIHRSYEQAKEVIRYGESAGKSVRVYGEMDALDEVVFYPVLTDDKISNYMIAGRAEEAKEVIMDVYAENFRDNAKMLSLEAIALVKYRIIKAVTSVAEKQEIAIHANTKKILTQKNVSKYFAALNELVDSIVKEIMAKKSNAQNILAVKVREYIQEHYVDCGLSIKQIANSFHFHENYISNLYKEEYGENLSNAIEQLRIDKACQLLSTTDIRIGEVAAAVGYSSDSSFRRAFKKITGVSPVDYRSSH